MEYLETKDRGDQTTTIYKSENSISKSHISECSRPLFTSRVAAGFPSPADDHLERSLDLNDYLIQNPPTTFFLKVQGDSMINASINNGDLLVVDKSLNPKTNDIVIAVLDGELTVKRLELKANMVLLKPENPKYPVITITDSERLTVWGVVTAVVHKTYFK